MAAFICFCSSYWLSASIVELDIDRNLENQLSIKVGFI